MRIKRNLVLFVAAAMTASAWAMAPPAAAITESPFEVQNGSILPASGTPMPASGTEAVLWSAASVATTTVEGSGRVLVGALGEWCGGWPSIQVRVDGVDVGTARLRGSSTYDVTAFGEPVQAGSHEVEIVMVNDRYVPSRCDRNAHLAYASIEQPTSGPPAGQPLPPPPAPIPPVPVPGQPGMDNTGVPSGVVLQQHNGDITITQDGTVIDGLDVHGFIDVQANNVVIQNSIIRGGDPGGSNRSLISAYGDHVNLVIQDTTLAGAVRSNNLDGLKGKNFTALRLDISGVVDTIQILGDNTIVQDSWLHGNLHLPDSRQSGGYTHDDSIQVEGGRNILIQHNSMSEASNAAVMMTQNVADTSAVHIISNWLNDGACSVNIAEKSRGPLEDILLSNNTFDSPYYDGCGVLVPATTRVIMVENVWADTGLAVEVRHP